MIIFDFFASAFLSVFFSFAPKYWKNSTEKGTDGWKGGGGLPVPSVRFFTVGRYSKDKTVISTQLGFILFQTKLTMFYRKRLPISPFSKSVP